MQSKFLSFDEVGIQSIYSEHHYLGYTLTPNYKSLDGLNIHNSLGCRGEEFSKKKQPGVYRIVMLGGSTTYTTFVQSYKESWPFLTQIMLRNVCNLDNIEVINAGVGGYDSYQT